MEAAPLKNRLSANDLRASGMPLPKAGSKAAGALAANAAKPVSRLDKMYKRSKRKPPTKRLSGVANKRTSHLGKMITEENNMYIMSIGVLRAGATGECPAIALVVTPFQQ